MSSLERRGPSWLTISDDDFARSHPFPRAPRTTLMNRVLVRSLRDVLREVPSESDVAAKPLLLNLKLPLPPRLRFYAFLATQHESERQMDTFRVQLTVGREGERSWFSREDQIRPILLGYVPVNHVWIIWDAATHDVDGFAYSRGVQAPGSLIYRGVGSVVDGERPGLQGGKSERIVVADRNRLAEGLQRRIDLSNAALGVPLGC